MEYKSTLDEANRKVDIIKECIEALGRKVNGYNEQGVRVVSYYPTIEMEPIYLKIMGIADNEAAIETEKQNAVENRIDWLIYLFT